MANSNSQWEENILKNWKFISFKLANHFLEIEKFLVNRKTAENNTLSHKKKLKYFTELLKDFGHFYCEIVGDIRAQQNFENRV